MMKKSLLALAVAALSANAFAVDLNASTSDAVNYAAEITLPAVLTDTSGGALDVSVKTGFSSTKDVKRYVRFDLTNAVFETAVVAGNLTTTATWDHDADGGTTPEVAIDLRPVVSVGGAKGDNYVVIEITPEANLANNAVLKLALANIKALGGDAAVQYRLYETGVDAASVTANTLASKSGKLFGFKSGLIAEVTTKGADNKIDVTQESKYFNGTTGDDNTNIGSLNAKVDTTVFAANGNALATLNQLLTKAVVEVSGDFSAGEKDADGKLLATVAKLNSVNATSIAADKATYELNVATVGLTAAALNYTVEGKSALETQSLTAKLVPTAATGYTVNSIDLGVLGNLEKNGSDAKINLALNPNGVYDNYVRISNTSNLAGKFFMTVIADDGTNVSFPLSDVAGQPAELAARASTTQITIKEIFAAAEAKGLSLAGQGKLRLVIEGEVPSLDAQTYTVSKDGNSFATF